MIDLDERLYVQHDANFNVTALVDTAGEVVERYVYDPYGNRTIKNDDWSGGQSSVYYKWEYGFQGARAESVTGQYDFRNRILSVSLGRPLQADPPGYVDGMNRYEWEGSNPVNRVDAFGMQSWYQGWGRTIGMMTGYYEGTSEVWDSFGEGYVQASYGAAGALSGGMLDSDYGFLGNKDDVREWLEEGGWGDAEDEAAYDSGATGGRVLAGTCVAAGMLHAVGLGGFSVRLVLHNPAWGSHKGLHFQCNWWLKGVKGSGDAFRWFPFK